MIVKQSQYKADTRVYIFKEFQRQMVKSIVKTLETQWLHTVDVHTCIFKSFQNPHDGNLHRETWNIKQKIAQTSEYIFSGRDFSFGVNLNSRKFRYDRDITART